MNEQEYLGFTQNDYLDAVAKKYELESDNQLAMKLGISRAAISHYRRDDRAMDDYCAAQIANLLKINPMMVIATANERREKTPARREYWQHMQACLATGGKLLSTALLGGVIALGGISAPKIADAAPKLTTSYTLCAIRRRTRRWLASIAFSDPHPVHP